MSTGPQETAAIMMMYTELKCMTITPQNQKENKWNLSVLRFALFGKSEKYQFIDLKGNH